ncbi:MAG: IclR family transcriptional regulator [Chloroflexota bacterium]
MLLQPTTVSSNQRAKKDIIGSVQRALYITELLARSPEGLNAKQISLKLTLNLSTCYHLLNTLEHEGYIVKDPDTLLFRLSGKIGYTAFAQATPAQLVKQLTTHVQELQEITQETAYLSIWDGAEVTVANIIEAANIVRVKSVTIGYTEGNHASALGKTILAYLPQDEFEQYFAERDLPAFTPNTITNLSSLRKYLSHMPQTGYALDAEEFMLDVHCISAPVFDAHDNITAAIAISLPSTRFERNSSLLIPKVKQIANSASRTLTILGYVGPARSSAEVV